LDSPGRLAVVDVEVMTSDASGHEGLNLAFDVLDMSRCAGVSDLFGHRPFKSVSQLMVQTRFYAVSCGT